MFAIIYYIFFYSSSKLPWAMLRSHPSLLWLAAEWGDDYTFFMLVDFLEKLKNVGMPEYAPGVPNIPAVALKSKHYGILEAVLQMPSIFPRYATQ